MSEFQLTAISPLDGRYADKTNELKDIFSEYGLIKYRYLVECEWFRTLANHSEIKEISPLSEDSNQFIHQLMSQFDLKKAQAIKNIEKTTNHDVKAVEYQLKNDLKACTDIADDVEFVHFACTSEDINNLSYGLMLKDGCQQIINHYEKIYTFLSNFAVQEKATAMLARTHGQPATPTSLGKEFANIAYRLKRQLDQLKKQTFLGKMNGAVGNFNAHHIAYPELNWLAISKGFIEQLGLTYNPLTTQIEPHDYIAEIMDTLARLNVILIDTSRDIWTYISQNYFKQKVITGEVGSSTMPHKVNPIDFENAEGNFGIANALAHHMSSKLPISRMQRDLSDSTVLRSLGSVFGYTLIALSSLNKGLNKLEVNYEAIRTDLERNPEVLAEAIQTVMRRYQIEEPYEKLKALTRGQKITQEKLQEFVLSLDIPKEIKQSLSQLTPEKYIGLAIILSNER